VNAASVAPENRMTGLTAPSISSFDPLTAGMDPVAVASATTLTARLGVRFAGVPANFAATAVSAIIERTASLTCLGSIWPSPSGIGVPSVVMTWRFSAEFSL